jgi:hypothetical protein
MYLLLILFVSIYTIQLINENTNLKNKKIIKDYSDIWCQEYNLKQMIYYEREKHLFHTICDILYQEHLKYEIKQIIDTNWDFQEKECLYFNDDEIKKILKNIPKSIKDLDYIRHQWIIKNYIYN